MGLLDNITGSSIEDPKTQAVAAMVGGLLGAHRPLQGVSSGLLAYGNSMAQQRAMKNQQDMQNLELQTRQLQLSQMQQQIARQNAIRDELAKAEAGGQLATPGVQSGAGPQSVAFTPEYNAQRAQAAQVAPGTQGPSASSTNLTDNLTQRLIQQAGIYARGGDFDTANKLYEQAAKFMPEVKDITVSMQNGKPVNVITYKNGKQQVSEFSPTPKLHFADQGGAIVPLDEYTGLPVNRGLQKSVSPDTAASNAVTMRGQDITDRRERQLGALSVTQDPNFGPLVINKVSGLSAPVTTVQGAPIPGENAVKSAKLTDQLRAGIEEARKLLPVATASGLGSAVDKSLGFFGRSTDSADAAAKLDTIAGWMTANVPRMEGPQSDRDVMQYRIMAARVGDRTVPVSQRLAALDTLQGLQQKYSGINQRSPFNARPAQAENPDPLGLREIMGGSQSNDPLGLRR